MRAGRWIRVKLSSRKKKLIEILVCLTIFKGVFIFVGEFRDKLRKSAQNPPN